ncbi:putative defense protein Hdd11 [Culicoides brevitarsis]|uniref:putative defense protein Hdd11 n=1 Tax=Culicoides brevitarsis TaxID=469753 RepID=UPI00307C58D4
MAFRYLTVLLVLSSSAVLINAYSKGAPKEACGDMVPQHHVDPQSTPAPYELNLSKNHIKAGETIQITLKGKEAKDKIKGLLVQARVGQTPIGKFSVPANNPHVQAINCGNGAYDALTHTKIQGDGPQSVSFSWTAPKELAETVTFYYTVALNGGVFWVAQTSEKLSVSA